MKQPRRVQYFVVRSATSQVRYVKFTMREAMQAAEPTDHIITGPRFIFGVTHPTHALTNVTNPTNA